MQFLSRRISPSGRWVFTASLKLLLALITLGWFASTSAAQTLTTMINNGRSNNRVDMIFIGDGYLNSQLNSVYVNHVGSTLDHFFNNSQDPFPRYRNFFNAHRVNIASNEEGADDPVNGIVRDTALDASYNTGGTDRCLYFNTNKANAAVSTALSGSGIDIDMRIGLVNSEKYGGCGGQWAVLAGAHSSGPEIALHEIGHSFANLADEYYTNGTTFNGAEPNSVNLTTNPALGKWDRWAGYVDPANPSIGPIGYYQGGGYNQFGLYRPSDSSKMRFLDRPFDAISREQFISRIYAEVDPLDDWLSNSQTLESPSELWVDTVDPSVISVDWFVNGQLVGNFGETLDVNSLGLATGMYTIEARAFDSILDFSFTNQPLDWWRYADQSSLRQNVSWNVNITAVPEPGAMLIGILAVGFIGIRRHRI